MTEQNTSWPGHIRPAAEPARRRLPPGQAGRHRRLRWLVSAAAAATALVVIACGCSGGGTPSHAAAPATGMAASGSTLKTTTINGVTVLTNAKGFTLYSFGPDTPTKSNCNGTCAQNWPPVQGSATASAATGKFGTIKRSDGTTQTTFGGHPLYTFVGDTAPGQAKGNALNAFGGIWYEVTASGTAAPATPSGGAGPSSGYGY